VVTGVHKELITKALQRVNYLAAAEIWTDSERLLVKLAAALEAAESPATIEWGVRIDGERPSETQVFDNEWAARDCAQNDKAWCSDAPRIVETRTVQRGQWGPTS